MATPDTEPVNDVRQSVWNVLRGLWTPVPSGAGPVVGSDAPGTNERDLLREGSDQERDTPRHSLVPKIPEPWSRSRPYGPGPSGTLGYRDHGDSVRIATRINERAHNTRARFPELVTHGRVGPEPPQYNQVYDILKTHDAYDKVVLATAHGSFIIGTTTNPQPVNLDTPGGTGVTPFSHLQLLGQFPGSLQMYPVLLLFTFGQSVTTATGEYSMVFTPDGGDVSYPLGEYNAGTGTVFNTMRHIIKAPITDPGKTFLGNLTITANTVTGTPTIFWRMGFGIALLLPAPAYKASEGLHVADWVAPAAEPPLQVTPSMVGSGYGPRP